MILKKAGQPQLSIQREFVNKIQSRQINEFEKYDVDL